MGIPRIRRLSSMYMAVDEITDNKPELAVFPDGGEGISTTHLSGTSVERSFERPPPHVLVPGSTCERSITYGPTSTPRQ